MPRGEHKVRPYFYTRSTALELFLLHSLLSLLDQCHQGLHFWFRRLEKKFYFLRSVVFFNELTNIEFLEPAVQYLEAGQSFLAAAAIGKTKVMPQNPAVPFPAVKIGA